MDLRVCGQRAGKQPREAQAGVPMLSPPHSCYILTSGGLYQGGRQQSQRRKPNRAFRTVRARESTPVCLWDALDWPQMGKGHTLKFSTYMWFQKK